MGGEAGDMPQTSFVKSKYKGGNASVNERVFSVENTLPTLEDIQADTNILLRSVKPAHLTHQQAFNEVTNLLVNGNRVCPIPQNIIEMRCTNYTFN
jgi:hypothetical protein